jgi:hypothetical protein
VLFESPLHVSKHSGWDSKALNLEYVATEIRTSFNGLLFNKNFLCCFFVLFVYSLPSSACTIICSPRWPSSKPQSYVRTVSSARHEGMVWDSWSVASLILDLGTTWKWLVSFTLLPLYTGRNGSSYPSGIGWVDTSAGLDVSEQGRICFLCLKSSHCCVWHPISQTRLW